jgi:hypothetical protein
MSPLHPELDDENSHSVGISNSTGTTWRRRFQSLANPTSSTTVPVTPGTPSAKDFNDDGSDECDSNIFFDTVDGGSRRNSFDYPTIQNQNQNHGNIRSGRQQVRTEEQFTQRHQNKQGASPQPLQPQEGSTSKLHMPRIPGMPHMPDMPHMLNLGRLPSVSWGDSWSSSRGAGGGIGGRGDDSESGRLPGGYRDSEDGRSSMRMSDALGGYSW